MSATDRGSDVRHHWHPFTPMREYRRLARLTIERGDGCWLIDTAGRRYLDGTASIWTSTLGHADPDLDAALISQLRRVAHSTALGLGNPTTQTLAEKLAAIAPDGLSRVFFSDNGSNAVEIAVKQSLQFWQLVGQPQRRRIVAMAQAYHGDTFGTMALGDCGAFHARFSPWFFPVDRFPAPVHDEAGGIVTASDTAPSLAALDAYLAEHGPETAALVLEPSIQGAAGMKLQPPGFARAVGDRCRAAGVHLILDEVFVGFGRTGSLLVCTDPKEAVTPDFLCLAKGLTGGYLPLAATLTNDVVFEAFLGEVDEWRTFYHGHTFTGNPLACAVALKNIEKVESLIACGQLATTVASFSRHIREHCLDHPRLTAVRQRGLAACLPLRGYFPVNDRLGMAVAVAARDHGVILRPLGDSLLVVPPLTINEAELGYLFAGLVAALDSVFTDRQRTAPRGG